MRGKGAAVFWIGLFLIFANFWVSGQSTVLWSLFTGAKTKTPTPKPILLPKKPGSPSPIG